MGEEHHMERCLLLCQQTTDAFQQVLQEADEEHDLVLWSQRQQLTRLRYQGQLAQRQYQQEFIESQVSISTSTRSGREPGRPMIG